jgi:integrase
MAKKFYLYARKRAGKSSVWYVRYRQKDGAIGSPIPTGEADEEKANEWAIEHLSDDSSKKARKPRVQTFEEWAEPWWRFESCPYIREKLAGGFTISRTYAEVRRSYLDRHLIPEFGSIPLTALSPRLFRDFKMRLFSEGKLRPATINRILGTARVMFNYAVSMGELEVNPVSPVKELKENPVARGILTPAELRLLFGPESFKTVWHEEPRHFAINLLAASTGMRLGECQALQMKYLHPEYIEIRHSWNDRYGLSEPKWGSARLVPVPSRTARALSDLVDLHRWGEPQPSDMVFWGKTRRVPLTKTAILKGFKAALARIEISEAERARRVLLFHSHRHGFNTWLRGKVPDEQLRRVTGHKTLAMSDNYDHAAIEHLADVKAAQETMFSKV